MNKSSKAAIIAKPQLHQVSSESVKDKNKLNKAGEKPLNIESSESKLTGNIILVLTWLNTLN